jgi:hypothetical protein
VGVGAVTPHGSAEAWADALCVDVYTEKEERDAEDAMNAAGTAAGTAAYCN